MESLAFTKCFILITGFPAYKKVELGASCPKYTRIFSEDECRIALAIVVMNPMIDTRISSDSSPGGCFQENDKRTYWNKNGSPASSSTKAPICRDFNENCNAIGSSFARHPEACNLYIDCKTGGILECLPGTSFNGSGCIADYNCKSDQPKWSWVQVPGRFECFEKSLQVNKSINTLRQCKDICDGKNGCNGVVYRSTEKTCHWSTLKISSLSIQSSCPFHVKNDTTTYMKLDIDECSLKMHNCDEKASCSNRAYSYQCECQDGYIGNGTKGYCKPPRYTSTNKKHKDCDSACGQFGL